MGTLEKLANAVARRKGHHNLRYHLFLTSSVSKHKTGRGYKILASLVQDSYFSTIFTASGDTQLEDELEALHLQYRVLIIGQHSTEQIVVALDAEEENSIHIVKLVDPEAQTEQPVLFSNLSDDIQNSLRGYFNQNIIIVGCIDQEEVAISALASRKNDGIYYVRETYPSPDDIVIKCITNHEKQVENFLIAGPPGEFNEFFSGLGSMLLRGQQTKLPSSPKPLDKRTPPSDETIGGLPLGPQPTRPLPIIPEPKRTNIFISYSHKNSMHLERLRTYLKLLERQGLINIKPWSDKEIKTGDLWREEIMRAIASAKIAILLISIDFLASDFIMDVEWPALQKGATNGEIIIIPVVVGSYDYATTEFAHFQSVNISRPLSMKADDEENDKVWKDVANRLREILIPLDPS